MVRSMRFITKFHKKSGDKDAFHVGFVGWLMGEKGANQHASQARVSGVQLAAYSWSVTQT